MKMLDHINIRAAKPADMRFLAELYEQTIRHVCKKDYNTEQIQAWASTASNHASVLKRIDEQYFIVTEINNNTITGFGSLSKLGYLDLLYVHKDYQGLGIASALLQKLVEKALNYGCTEITTDASRTARPFFESRGFKVIKDQTVSIKGITLENFKMLINLV